MDKYKAVHVPPSYTLNPCSRMHACVSQRDTIGESVLGGGIIKIEKHERDERKDEGEDRGGMRAERIGRGKEMRMSICADRCKHKDDTSRQTAIKGDTQKKGK